MLDPHPVWHELVARLGASDAELECITRETRDLLETGESHASKLVAPSVSRHEPLRLPEARGAWIVDGKYLRASTTYSASNVDTLLGCPLRWAFSYKAKLRGDWRRGKLTGWIDVLLRDTSGRDVVIDLKWGRATYKKLLEAGLSTQLAVYAASRRATTGARNFPVTAYVALGRGELLATDVTPFPNATATRGPTVGETWGRLERTLDVVEPFLAKGIVPVTGVSRGKSLLHPIGVDESDHDRASRSAARIGLHILRTRDDLRPSMGGVHMSNPTRARTARDRTLVGASAGSGKASRLIFASVWTTRPIASSSVWTARQATSIGSLRCKTS